MNIKISPSLLSADFARLGEQIRLAEEGGADMIHLDVMDGHFVPNITFGPPVIRSIRKTTPLPLDTHLMIENPDSYLEDFRSAGSDVITVHVETCPHLHRTLQHIRSLGARAGVSINPATPLSSIEQIISEVDLLLIMSVNPGFGGQTFIPFVYEKIRDAATLLRSRNPSSDLAVDGGIDLQTAPRVVSAGATILVAGNYVYGSPDPPKAIRDLRNLAKHADS